jgi:hypothetical protein
VSAAFFCISNSPHFIGAAALLNSLREVGHDEPFYLVDCGLTDHERALLDGHATIIPAPTDLAPTLIKAFGPLEVDPEIAVILDADIIVQRPLDDLFGPKPVVFLNDLTFRFQPDWIRLGFGRLNRIPYLNAGQMILPRSSGLLPLLHEGHERLFEILDAEPDTWRTWRDPFFYRDQDVLNALIGSLDPEDYVLSDEIAYWPFEEPYENARMLHHIMDKPWLSSLRPNPYSEAMIRLLSAGPVVVPADEIPARLRAGSVGTLARGAAAVTHTVRDHTRGRLGLRHRLAERRAAAAS